MTFTKEMTGYEALESFCSAFTLAANLVVAIVCLSAFKRMRIAALMLLGISAALAIFTILTETFMLRRIHDESTYAVIWTGTTILWLIDIGLYAVGVTKLVAWITQQKRGEQGGDGDAEEAV